jgi:hypothetical protein
MLITSSEAWSHTHQGNNYEQVIQEHTRLDPASCLETKSDSNRWENAEHAAERVQKSRDILVNVHGNNITRQEK